MHFMGNTNYLQNIVPMNLEEIDDAIPVDVSISAPSIKDSDYHVHISDNFQFADFSQNSFVVQDEAASTPENNVYMESIVTLIGNINTKIEQMKDERTEDKIVLKKVLSFLKLGDMQSAEIEIEKSNVEIDTKCILFELLEKILPDFFIKLKEEMVQIKESSIGLKVLFSELENKLFKKLEENDRLKTIISQQSKDHNQQIDELTKEHSTLKDRLEKMLQTFGGNRKIESYLHEDVINELEDILKSKDERVDNLEKQLLDKENKLNEYARKEKQFDVAYLNSQVDSFRELQKKLQDENLNLTNVVNKISEKNTKLKQDLIFFNSELKRASEAINKKNETISRQKSLIELFQDKISGTSLPIEELRRKKFNIEQRLLKETDYFVKQNLKKEKEDCDKRLSDFLSVNKDAFAYKK